MTSTPRRLRLASQAWATYSGRPLTIARPSGVRAWPNLALSTTWSRRPRTARPRSSSLWPKPYASEESKRLTPRSRARWTTSMDCASSPFPYVPDMDMQPRPSAGTESELWPSVRCSIDASHIEYRAILHHPIWGPAGGACYNSVMLSLTQSLPARSADLQAALHADPNGFPFKTELSLAPLLAFWGKKFGDDTSAKGTFVRMVREQVKQVPELMVPITDLGVIERHRQLVDLLMAGIFAPAFFEQEFSAVLVPFQLKSFYATPPFERHLRAEDGTLRGRVNLDAPMVSAMRIFFAYALVLERIYGINLIVDYPLVLTVPDPDTKLDRHFKMELDWRFVEVKTVGDVPPLSDEIRRRLRRDVLPPDRFMFSGFTIFRAIEVTDQEVLSSLERDLIDKESIVSHTRFGALQAKLRTLFRRPELRFGLAALDGDQVLVLNYGAEGEHA